MANITLTEIVSNSFVRGILNVVAAVVVLNAIVGDAEPYCSFAMKVN